MRSPVSISAPLGKSAGKLARSLASLALFAFVVLFASDARAAGVFKLKTTEVNEVSGAWHIYVTLELPKAPPIAHQSMKFLFTKTVAYERSLIDGHEGPVLNRQALQNQTPSVESLDVDFADPSGKIFKGTRFDFGLTRARGYEAGEYKVEVKTSDGATIGGTQNLTLKGDNEVVDRRAMTFNAKEKPIKKVDGYDAGAPAAKNAGDDAPASAGGNGEVQASGEAQPFIPKEGFEKTNEEEIKERPHGCGCSIPGSSESSPLSHLAWLAPLAGLGLVAARRRRA
ncbi:MYXO-CTERM sorting domain-containing protein [Labilithrix luteola]|nr:MYXO-CTERM sorting domain-containing protein [Labilithrix luteola]